MKVSRYSSDRYAVDHNKIRHGGQFSRSKWMKKGWRTINVEVARKK
jgi:hypothetical protein